MNIATLLDELAEIKAQADLLRIDQQKAIDGILTPEIKAQIATVEVEYAPALDTAAERSSDLEKRIKAATVALGKSIKGTRLQAVFSRRTSWDTRALTGYAAAHPEIDAFKKISESVSIRIVK